MSTQEPIGHIQVDTDHGYQFIAGDGVDDLMDGKHAVYLQAERQVPCSHFCEAKAFEIEIRQLKAENARLHGAIDEANKVEPVGYTGSGSIDAVKVGVEGHLFGSSSPSHPIALYTKQIPTIHFAESRNMVAPEPSELVNELSAPYPHPRISAKDVLEIAQYSIGFMNGTMKDALHYAEQFLLQKNTQELIDKLNGDRSGQ